MSGESNPKIGGYSIGQVRRREAMHSLDQLSLEFRAAEDGCMVIGHVDHPQWMWRAVLLAARLRHRAALHACGGASNRTVAAGGSRDACRTELTCTVRTGLPLLLERTADQLRPLAQAHSPMQICNWGRSIAARRAAGLGPMRAELQCWAGPKIV